MYEKKHHDLGPPDPIEAIRLRVEQEGLSKSDLGDLLGGASRVLEVLSGKRALSISMIRSHHDELGIPAEVVIAGKDENSVS